MDVLASAWCSSSQAFPSGVSRIVETCCRSWTISPAAASSAPRPASASARAEQRYRRLDALLATMSHIDDKDGADDVNDPRDDYRG